MQEMFRRHILDLRETALLNEVRVDMAVGAKCRTHSHI